MEISTQSCHLREEDYYKTIDIIHLPLIIEILMILSHLLLFLTFWPSVIVSYTPISYNTCSVSHTTSLLELHLVAVSGNIFLYGRDSST